jgi:hypothetical protein
LVRTMSAFGNAGMERSEVWFQRSKGGVQGWHVGQGCNRRLKGIREKEKPHDMER